MPTLFSTRLLPASPRTSSASPCWCQDWSTPSRRWWSASPTWESQTRYHIKTVFLQYRQADGQSAYPQIQTGSVATNQRSRFICVFSPLFCADSRIRGSAFFSQARPLSPYQHACGRAHLKDGNLISVIAAEERGERYSLKTLSPSPTNHIFHSTCIGVLVGG